MNDILFLYRTSNYKLKLEFLFIEIISIFNGLLQGLSIISLGPFILLITDFERATENYFMKFLYEYLKFSDNQNFIFFYGIIVILLIIISNIFFLYSNLLLTRFGFNYGESLQRRLFDFYLKRSINDFIKLNSSEMIAKIYFQTYRISNTIVVPILDLFSKLFISIVIILIMCLMINFIFLSLLIIILLLLYLIIYFITKNKLFKTDQILTNLEKKKYKILGDSLRGINIIKIFKKENLFLNIFNKLTYPVANNRAIQRVIASSPKFIIEMIVFVVFILIMMLFINSGDKIIEVAPIASVLFYSIYKLIPYVQGIFYDFVNIKGNLSSIKDLKEELSNNDYELINNHLDFKFNNINNKNIKIENLFFVYGDKFKIDNINFELQKKSLNFIFGKSGSGKSTLAKLLVGLYKNYQGNIYYEDINRKNISDEKFFSKITFVDQNTFLFDESILFNITFENDFDKINKEHYQNVIKICQLDRFISKQQFEHNTLVGENGVKISGGEKQRIGLARAIYKMPEFLILDEATNSLDLNTEKKIFEYIRSNKEKCTCVIITHNINLLNFSDKIVNIDKGIKTFEGTFSEFKKI